MLTRINYGLETIWESLTGVVYHQGGGLSWSLIKVLSHQDGGLPSGRSLIIVIFHQGLCPRVDLG